MGSRGQVRRRSPSTDPDPDSDGHGHGHGDESHSSVLDGHESRPRQRRRKLSPGQQSTAEPLTPLLDTIPTVPVQTATTTTSSLIPNSSDRTGDMGPPIRVSNGVNSNGVNHSNGVTHDDEASRSLPTDLLDAVRPLASSSTLMYEDDKDWTDSSKEDAAHFVISDDEEEDGYDAAEGSSKRRIRPGQSQAKRMPIQREEIVRIMLQGLRDMGYEQAADVLEAESGFQLSGRAASDFEAAVLGGRWSEAIELFSQLGVPVAPATGPEVASSSSSIASGKSKAVASGKGTPAEQARFLISQQKYLEYLELGQQKKALAVLRSELAPVAKDSEVLHTLSGYMMCMDKDDLYERANWDGAGKTSRRRLLEHLQAFISAQVMVPSRRLATLLDQARRHQMADCMYHDDIGAISLYKDHECASGEFPSLCTHILADHSDEVWRIEWSPDGMMLASAGKDQTVVIWQLKIIDGEDGTVRYGIDHLHILSEHRHPIDAMAWSPSGRTLVVGAEKNVYIWDIKTGKQKSNTILPSPHLDMITTIRWLPDGSGFIVASQDFKVVFYNATGSITRSWTTDGQQYTDFVITPDSARIIALTCDTRRGTAGSGGKPKPVMSSRVRGPFSTGPRTADAPQAGDLEWAPMERGMLLIRIADRVVLDWLPDLRIEPTSLALSSDGRRLLINCNPAEVQLWAIEPQFRFIRKFTGHVQNHFLVRSSFGAPKDKFILSGSEDGSVYVWQGESSEPFEVLAGHNETVNAVAWNPVSSRKIIASCSDDWTVRIWQPRSAAVVTGDGVASEEAQEDEVPAASAAGLGTVIPSTSSDLPVHDEGMML